MLISELKAADLLALRRNQDVDTCIALADRMRVYPASTLMENLRDVEHRGLLYTVGHWGEWQGDFWVVEAHTGDIFRGTLGYIKEMIALCSACAKGEGQEVRP